MEAMMDKRKKYSVGFHSYELRKHFDFVRKDYEKYKRITEAIEAMEQERDHQQLGFDL